MPLDQEYSESPKLRMISPAILVCPTHHSRMALDESRGGFVCLEGCVFPLVGGIPRFVSTDMYASSFGLQWNRYQKTQLDSFTRTSISKDKLTRVLGGSLDIVRGKKVLEAGCGAGRFTEVLLAAGADVVAFDLSVAVEANHRNCSAYNHYFVCQADILEMPFVPEEFDIVICIGVIQHTPDPEQTIAALCKQVRHGGLLIIDHYTSKNRYTSPTRRFLRAILIRLPKSVSFQFTRIFTQLLWPLHRLLWKHKHIVLVRKMRTMLRLVSPVNDYQDNFPQLGPNLLREWALLDTHDSLTDFYKHLRTSEQIESSLLKNGMVEVETHNVGVVVEAKAVKPPLRRDSQAASARK